MKFQASTTHVSTLVTVVGQPYRPTLAGNGGLSRGLPCSKFIVIVSPATRNALGQKPPGTGRLQVRTSQSVVAQGRPKIHVQLVEVSSHRRQLSFASGTPTCLPSSDSMSAVSSPQMYAPAP